MKVRVLSLISLFLACFATFSTDATVVKGKLAVEHPATVSVIDRKGFIWPVNINHLDTAYSIEINNEKPEIMTLFFTYTDTSGKKSQLYTPIIVDPEEDPIVVDIEYVTGYPVLSAESVNQMAFLDYTDFLVGNLKGGVSERYTDQMAQNIRRKTSDLRQYTSPLVGDYLELWGESTIWLAKRLQNRRKQMQADSVPAYANLSDLSIDQVMKNKALKYFPEFVDLVLRSKVSGKTLVDRVKSLEENLPEGDNRDFLETRLIDQYVNRTKGKLEPEKILSQLEIVARDNPEYENWVYAVKNYHSYLQRGDLAPDDVILTADGKEFRISDFKGKYLFIDFWASWCVYCVKELPALEQIKNEFADSDIEFIGISVDENIDNWKAALEKHGLSGNQYVVTSPDLAEKLGISSIPRYIIYDKESRMLYPEAPRPRQYEKLTDLLKSLG